SGDAVAATHKIETEAASGASVVLRDGTVLVLGPSSQLDLKQFSFDTTTQEGGLFVSLARGSLRMISGLLGKRPETVRIDTQTATIGIRGTDFIVTSEDKM
ncbi:MAG TPA: FecR family protein, partial [Variovorax sp.]|nr:FecR family protein [Variovorax sp.]